ncbi:aminotransferase class I/II-fold pyridoxal phosphate-dependent enzyme, partial [archaeon]
CADLRAVPEGSIILLHACAHNPTGVDPTPEQWVVLRSILKERKALPWFDTAYQGFASGSPDTDAATIRMFAEEVCAFPRMRACRHCSRRCCCACEGAALRHAPAVRAVRMPRSLVCRATSSLCVNPSPRTLACTRSASARCTWLRATARPRAPPARCSSPSCAPCTATRPCTARASSPQCWATLTSPRYVPLACVRACARVASNAARSTCVRARARACVCVQEWRAELATAMARVKRMRALLRAALEERKTPGDWSHITSQIGMFSYTGLTAPQCARLIREFHVYLMDSGRINVAGMNEASIPYLADAIHTVVTTA